MARNAVLIDTLNNLLEGYFILMSAECLKNSSAYNYALEKIALERQVIEILSKEPDFDEMFHTAEVCTDSLYIEEALKANDIRDPDFYITTCKFLNARVKALKNDHEDLTKAFMKDFDKSVLITIKDMMDSIKDVALRETYIELYYFIIFTSPYLESELITDPSLLNMPSSYLRRMKKEDPSITDSSIYSLTLEVLNAMAESLVDSYDKISYSYQDTLNQIWYEAAVKSLLSKLSKKDVLYFKAICNQKFTDPKEGYGINIINLLIDERLKSCANAKIVSIATAESME